MYNYKLQHIACYCLLFFSFFSFGLAAQNPDFSGGNGTSGDPYQIQTAQQFDNLRKYLGPNYASTHFRLVDHIDLSVFISTHTNTDIQQNGWLRIGYYVPYSGNYNYTFQGTLHGGGYEITGLWSKVRNSNNEYIGLFGALSNATIDSLTIHTTDVGIQGKTYVGALAGEIFYGTAIRDCTTTGNVTASNVGSEIGGGTIAGGLIGRMNGNSAKVIKCSSSCQVTGAESIGGLIGRVNACDSVYACSTMGDINGINYTGGLIGQFSAASGKVSNCYSSSQVTARTSNSLSTGGLIGRLNNGSVSVCCAFGNVNTSNFTAAKKSTDTGGLVGTLVAPAKLSDCYATGNVAGGGVRSGGLVGYVSIASATYYPVTNCYASGNVTAYDFVGGLIGYTDPTVTSTVVQQSVAANAVLTITNTASGASLRRVANTAGSALLRTNYALSSMSRKAGSATYTVPLIIGLNEKDGAGKSLEELKTRVFYAGLNWNFDNIWAIIEGNTLPFFSFIPPSDCWLSGDYLIGTGGDYENLQSAVNVYNICGLRGNTRFLITESFINWGTIVARGSAPGSDRYTLIIMPHPDGGPKIITANHTRTFFRMEGARNITIDGGVKADAELIDNQQENTRLRFNGNTLWRQPLFSIEKDADGNPGKNITISNISVSTDTVSSSTAIRVTTDSVIVSGCYLHTTACGIMAGNVKSFYCRSNVLKNMYETGICIRNTVSVPDADYKITGNSIKDIYNDTFGFYASGIEITQDIGETGGRAEITENVLENIRNDIWRPGYYAYGLNLGMKGNLFVANNIIHQVSAYPQTDTIAGKYGAYGINLRSDLFEVLHNTVVMPYPLSGNGQIAAVYCSSALPSEDAVIANNILINRDTYENDGSFLLCVCRPVKLFGNIYFSGNGNLGRDGTGGLLYRNIAAWNTVMNDHSRFHLPEFRSDNDLHLSGVSLTDPLLSARYLRNKVEMDFEGEMRTVCNNAAGADVHPAAFLRHYNTWTPQPGNNDWNDYRNWENDIPQACTSVCLPGSLTAYPELNASEQAICDTVFFAPGSTLAKTAYLNYQYAKADLKLDINRWYILSPPLGSMYSGDYFLDECFSSDALAIPRWSPAVWSMLYQTNNPQKNDIRAASGQWSKSYKNVDIPFQAGMGYAIWVDNGQYDKETHPSFTFHFPKDSVNYFNYDKTGRKTTLSGNLDRAHTGRFIYETTTGWDQLKPSFRVPVLSDGANGEFSSAIIGNPYLSHLDFERFYTENQEKIENSYHIWGNNGNSFVPVLVIEDGSILSPEDDANYIAPMQAFIVNKKPLNPTANPGDFIYEPVGNLLFTPEMSVVAPEVTLRTSEHRMPNVLNISVLSGGEKHSAVAVRYLKGENNAYDPAKDVWTMFADNVTSSVVIYSVLEGKAASIHTIGDLSEPLELGISTSLKGPQTLSFRNVGSFDPSVSIYLEDRNSGIYPLTKGFEYTFENETGDIRQRFFLHWEQDQTDLNEIKECFSVFSLENEIHVHSAGALITQVDCYDTQGRLIASELDVYEKRCRLKVPVGKQVVIVKVKAMDTIGTYKLQLK